MAYTLKTNLANKSNYGGYRSTTKIQYIVIHYTGNDGDTDESNAKYFKNNVVKVSAHYFVDDDSVTQSVPDNYVAWAVGGNRYSNYKTTGGASCYGKCTNTNSISIEICDDVKNGTIYPSAQTIANAVELTKKLMKKYNVPKARVIRHFDVTGKSCPAYWCGSAVKNALWGKDFWHKLDAVSNTSTPAAAYSLKDFVTDIQKAIGAKVDGIAGSETLAKTVTVSATKNSTHAVVKPIQKRLNALGYDCGTADGIAGAKFTATVKAFQRAKGCIVDGEITEKGKTWKKLLEID